MSRLFEVAQKLDVDFIDDELVDRNELILGYVEDEYFAREFCETHPECSYGPVIPIKYPIYLEDRMCHDVNDLMLLRIPVLKGEDDYEDSSGCDVECFSSCKIAFD